MKLRASEWPRRMTALLLAGVTILLAGEAFCRFVLGLGDPPLAMVHPQIEYLFKPDQQLRRLGNQISYNRWSMRSAHFSPQKKPGELRVMVFGDSVINGGALVDQKDLTTSILEDALEEALGVRVVVGNISAGSWGPPNWLAYAEQFGLFDADIVAIVASSHDYADVPSSEPVVGVSPDMPEDRPWSALAEGITRYLPRYIPSLSRQVPPKTQPSPHDIAWALAALDTLIGLAQTNGAQVICAQHLEVTEVTYGKPLPGHDAIRDVCRHAGVEPFDIEGHGTPRLHYRDSIHLSSDGDAAELPHQVWAGSMGPKPWDVMRSQHGKR